MSQFRLAIAQPSGPLWWADFGMCLLNMMLYMMQHAVPGYSQNVMKLMNKRSALLPKSRQELIDDALAAECTHLLFIDSDQTFPANLVHLLARHGKNVIACNVATKVVPSNPTARNYNPNYAGGDVVFTNEDSHGLEKVWRIGTGVMLLNLQVMQHIPKPWFEIVWYAPLNDFCGEDWYFCQKLEAAGVPLWIDHDVSKEIGHIGQYTYGHSDVGPPVREEEAARLMVVGE